MKAFILQTTKTKEAVFSQLAAVLYTARVALELPNTMDFELVRLDWDTPDSTQGIFKLATDQRRLNGVDAAKVQGFVFGWFQQRKESIRKFEWVE